MIPQESTNSKKLTNLFLIGYRGTGKTTLGRAVARKLKMNFIDADDLLVETIGKSIPKIFESEGEDKFREYETQILKEICKKENIVVGCGGGIVTREENIKLLKENGVVCLLTADPKVIHEWIYGDKNRPSLTDKDPYKEIVFMMEKRKPLYNKAKDFSVDTGVNNIPDSVKRIIEGYKKVLEIQAK